ncbi:hypothetical protein SAMN04487968_101428 [Nocardioides terrae]|uniref:Uncharacterized protein n=1 Tax=Nocardioides terrae TaxID=574651 RepID=A0A1I1DRJ0_9ACTN|nr:hypothetical protein [Nocardioides terrae]SFB77036.1 hypothetical protein SAMN04487968_101428 [Nocardioides terrae]
MRLYVPATIDLLARWHTAGEVPASDPGVLGAFEPPDDTEDGEYTALMSAADVSADLLAGPGRRVVLVVEAASPSQPVPARSWAAVHADLAERPAGADPDEDLGWFATQEIPDLIT